MEGGHHVADSNSAPDFLIRAIYRTQSSKVGATNCREARLSSLGRAPGPLRLPDLYPFPRETTPGGNARLPEGAEGSIAGRGLGRADRSAPAQALGSTFRGSERPEGEGRANARRPLTGSEVTCCLWHAHYREGALVSMTSRRVRTRPACSRSCDWRPTANER